MIYTGEKFPIIVSAFENWTKIWFFTVGTPPFLRGGGGDFQNEPKKGGLKNFLVKRGKAKGGLTERGGVAKKLCLLFAL